MAVYPIKMLKDEGNNPFVPLVGTNAIVDAQGQSLDDKFATKLEAVNIIAGENITLQKVGNNITINGGAGSSVSLIDNLTTASPGLGALDARQGKALKDLIPAVINNLNSTSTVSALSAYQGYLLKNRVVPAGGTTGQVLKKSSNADNAVEWGDNITVENNLTSTSTTNALSANQGRILNGKIPTVNNTLTSTSTTQALSANQGKILKELVDGKVSTSIAVPANADLNTYTTTGFYYCNSNSTVATMTNVPEAKAFSLLVERHAGIKQTFTTYQTDVCHMYVRNYYSGSWGPWKAMHGEIVLYDNAAGSNGNITLSDNISNYTYIEIFYKDNNNRHNGYTKAYNCNGTDFDISMIEAGSGSTYWRRTRYTASGTSLTVQLANSGYSMVDSGSGKTANTSLGTNYLKIMRVVGIR